ncbi:hypothetical protein CVT24_006318 [Panaeolus cyanescens]|uniref:Uncharacterized protein n=1 Tax=Panaeolus cyanescens TaxID=181874 RepID=A0A409YEC0_9AGAR|nr:hypothetical protein CVT24_006318 [Panaeolus cyanescens]
MIKCRCIVNGCSRYPGGEKKIPVIDAQAHRRAEKERQAEVERMVEEREIAAQRAIEAQDNNMAAAQRDLEAQDADLAGCIASLTLADLTTGPRTTPSSPQLEFVDQFASLTISDRNSTNPSLPSIPDDLIIHRVEKVFSSLSELHSSLDSVSAACLAYELHPDMPTSLDSVFPLSKSLEDVRTIEAAVCKINTTSPEIKERKKALLEKAARIQANLLEQRKCWNAKASSLPAENHPSEPSALGESFQFLTEHHFNSVLPNADPLVQLGLFMMASLRVVFHNSRDSCRWLLQMLSFFVFTALGRHPSSTIKPEDKLIKTFPRDPDTVLHNFNLESKTVIYAVCPNSKCHKLYSPVLRHGDPRVPQYPRFCTHNPFPNDPDSTVCGQVLTEIKTVDGVSITVPIKRFVYFDFCDWLAGLLARPGYEDYMDRAWVHTATDGVMSDIFDGKFLREFKGPDGKAHFSVGGDSSRYVLSLCVDNFNPQTNKQAGKKASIGLISGTLLNLPPHL